MTGNVLKSRVSVVSFNMLLVYEALFLNVKRHYIRKFRNINIIANIGFLWTIVIESHLFADWQCLLSVFNFRLF